MPHINVTQINDTRYKEITLKRVIVACFFILICVTAPLVSAEGTSQSAPPSGERGEEEREQWLL